MDIQLTPPRKRLLEYLPAIYQEPGPRGGPSFLGRFLLAFDRLLLDGDWDGEWQENYLPAGKWESAFDEEPLERKIARLHLLFNPYETPEEFLPWLASWVALSFNPELSVRNQRRLLAAIASLYPIRGTRAYLQELLGICLDVIAVVSDHELPALRIGSSSHVGQDTYIDGGAAHFFRVRLLAPNLNAIELDAQSRLAISLIELSKPAHTCYELEVVSRRMQIGVSSSVGLDTILS